MIFGRTVKSPSNAGADTASLRRARPLRWRRLDRRGQHRDCTNLCLDESAGDPGKVSLSALCTTPVAKKLWLRRAFMAKRNGRHRTMPVRHSTMGHIGLGDTLQRRSDKLNVVWRFNNAGLTVATLFETMKRPTNDEFSDGSEGVTRRQTALWD